MVQAWTWSGPDGYTKIEIENGPKLAAGLKVAPRAMKRELRKSHAVVAREVRGWERSAAKAGSAQQRRMAGGIGASANSTQAILTVKNTRTAPGAIGAFMGAKKYPQFPSYVGNNWKVGGPGGPRVINPTLRKHERDIATIFVAGQVDAVHRATGL